MKEKFIAKHWVGGLVYYYSLDIGLNATAPTCILEVSLSVSMRFLIAECSWSVAHVTLSFCIYENNAAVPTRFRSESWDWTMTDILIVFEA